ncbi:MAG TPA: hypothetical protein VHW09_19345 [Bryobacteraceae bacterium]|jgi:hypothetical protein|nr:hypothetical protein [Bryobacteraceae bacterium]
MQEDQSPRELEARLALIETMIAEGRRTTQRWAWAFVLWGVAYYVAIAWSAWGPMPDLSWPITMFAAAVLTALLCMRQSHSGVETAAGRAIGAIWIATGITMFVLLGSLGATGRLEPHVFASAAAALLGAANATSSMVLKWRVQFACALVWWGAAVAACFVGAAVLAAIFLVTIFLCQIVFGIYGMIAESRKPSNRPAHA